MTIFGKLQGCVDAQSEMTPSDHAIVSAVLRHNGIPDAEHGACIAFAQRRGGMIKRAMNNFKSIYASFTHEERQACQK